MRLKSLCFDDIVVIDGPITVAGGPPGIREQRFHIDDGWDIRETLPGIFTLCRDDMTEPVTIGGYGYSYVRMPGEEIQHDALVQQAPKKGKRH